MLWQIVLAPERMVRNRACSIACKIYLHHISHSKFRYICRNRGRLQNDPFKTMPSNRKHKTPSETNLASWKSEILSCTVAADLSRTKQKQSDSECCVNSENWFGKRENKRNGRKLYRCVKCDKYH